MSSLNPRAATLFAAAPPESFGQAIGTPRFADLLARLQAEGHHDLRRALEQPALQALFAGIAAFSPYLTRLTLRHAGYLEAGLAAPLWRLCEDELDALERAAPDLSESTALQARLRQAKGRIALLIALADMGGLWGLDDITAMLSRFAEGALDFALAHEMRALYQRGELAPPAGDWRRATPAIARDSGYVLLALGKLGGGELNYSSDIDLIALYDEEKIRYQGRRTPADCFIRLTQRLVGHLQDRTGEGYVFRVDLRLRPDPGATPVAVSMTAAENYYQSIGQTWERAAYIKARPVAGDVEAGHAFLKRIRPFVWRRHLDFAAINDIQAMKRRVHEHHQHDGIGFAGHDVKLGVGGIREIEFFAQIHQLISGGRRPDLRTRTTLETLASLAKAGDIAAADHDTLAAAYRFLRRIEHRLQMVEDQQTQRLPGDEAKLTQFARFFGYDETSALAADFRATLAKVHALYERLLPGQAPAAPTPVPSAFAQRPAVAAVVSRWRAGRYRALKTARARALFEDMLPALLAAFAKAAEPEQALVRFDQFLSELPSGVQLFSLFQANPNLFHLIARIMGRAPALAEQLARRPALLDSVLSYEFFTAPPDAEALREELAARLSLARHYEEVLDQARIWLNERRFQVGVLMLDGIIDPVAAGAALARLADATLHALLPHVEEEFSHTAGRLPGGAFAILALGGYGARCLTYTSDLDLVFLYDCPPDASAEKDGKSLSPNHYYSRLSQRIISALTVLTGEGRLFEVDMRLRPSGRAGLIAVSLDAFVHYQSHEAWAWEHMSLAKARIVAGDPALAARVTGAIGQILERPRDPRQLASAIWDMRRRFDKEFGPGDIWALKTARGGLSDLDWLVQYLLLTQWPRLAAPPPDIAGQLACLGASGVLAADDAETLADAFQLLFSARALRRLLIGPRGDFAQASISVRAALAQALGETHFSVVTQRVKAAKQSIARLFSSTIPELQDHAENKGGQP